MFTAVITNITAAAADPQAAGIIDWVNTKTAATQTAIQGILIVVGLIVAIIIAWRGKTVGSVIMAVAIGGLIIALPTLITFFGGAAGEEVTTTPVAAYAYAAIATKI